jgi:hypothetical protein
MARPIDGVRGHLAPTPDGKSVAAADSEGIAWV